MSEDIINLLAPVPRWRLSGHDAGIVDDLKEVIRFWLPALTDAEDLSCAVVMLRDLDGIVAGHPPSQTCEFTVSKIDPKRGGVSATIIMSSDQMLLDCSEWTPNVNGKLDSGPLFAGNGLLLHLCLDQMGSYDREHFNLWRHLALETSPQEPRDQTVKGTLSVQH